ncbi:MAG: hypothetical protein EAS52_15100 [Parapedobacter sp.]|nr:MAG: hypothetical protein EAS52_15100 [Parapedobacter sp.]
MVQISYVSNFVSQINNKNMKTKTHLFKYLTFAIGAAVFFTSCSDDEETIPDIPPSEGTELTLNGGVGGSAAQNIVFVDLSAAKQDSAKRESWDLGFYCGNDFRVILNSSKGAITALNTQETDINAVTPANVDVNELALGLNYETYEFIGSFDLIDDTTGNLNNTAIDAISTGENPVYIVNTVGGATVDPANVWKVKISQSTNGYSVQYAKLDATNVQTIEIQKDSEYNFKHFSFTGGIVNVEPPKTEWDFSWGYTIYFTMLGTDPVPYNNSDFIKLNTLNGVQAAMVKEADIAYASFSEANISSISFSGNQNVIGANWRTVPSPTPGVEAGTKKDRYYVIKDVAGNIYKLKFNSFTAEDAGKRGYPELEYQLVKRG